MKKFKPILLILGLGIILGSCYYDNEEALFPSLPGSCDTTLVSYATDIVPIISDYCLLCHSNQAAASLGSNIKLEDYPDFASSAERVLGSVKHESSYSPMPKGGGKLNACQIDKLEAWINQGKNNN